MHICKNPLCVLIFTILCSFSSTVAFAWDPIKDLTGERLDEHMQNLANSGEAFRKKPIDYLRSRPGKILSEACAAPMGAYAAHLRRASNGLWKRLPLHLVVAMQRHYPQQNLHTVRYAENISTSDGTAQTFTNEIYFPRRINLKNRNDLRWMLHELEHVIQYAGRGSQAALLCEYQFKAIGKGLQRKTFNPHDFIDLERAADLKANRLLSEAYQVMLTDGRGSRSPVSSNAFRRNLPQPSFTKKIPAIPYTVRSRDSDKVRRR